MTKSNFLNKKITRGQFLTYLGLVMLSITGISGAVKRVNRVLVPKKTAKVKNSFGGSVYGGVKV